MIVVLSKTEKNKLRKDRIYARQMEQATNIAANNRALFKYVSAWRHNPMAQIVVRDPSRICLQSWRTFNVEKETENELHVWEV